VQCALDVTDDYTELCLRRVYDVLGLDLRAIHGAPPPIDIEIDIDLDSELLPPWAAVDRRSSMLVPAYPVMPASATSLPLLRTG
jgi:hypothetical protein